MKTLITLLLFLLLIPFNATSADRDVIISTGEWAPWTGRELPNNGFINHVVKEAFAREGYEVRFEYYPWPRSNDLIKHGNVDASSYWYKNEDREDFAIFSDAISTEDVVFFHLKGKTPQEWHNLEDLRSYRIGAVKGITYVDELWEKGRAGTLRLFPSNTHKDNFNKLIRDRIDIFPSARRMGLEILTTNFPPQEQAVISHTSQKLSSHDGFLVFPKNASRSEELRKAFNTGLRKLREDGTYAKYLQAMDEGFYSAHQPQNP